MEITISNKDLITAFIKNNDLVFEDGNRNAPCVTLCGYALYLGIETEDELVTLYNFDIDTQTELQFVFPYAKKNNYGKWWENESAHKLYKF